ncbi:MAG: hypothetical protein WB565_10970 [Acidimicrobiales bacterium]
MKQIGVDFIDILFGFVVAEIFAAFTTVQGNEYASWANLILALAIVVFSWLGYHKAKDAYSRTISFRDPSIIQFLIDVGVVALYLALVKQSEHAQAVARLAPHQPLSIRPQAITIIAIFGLYLIWDLLQIHLADDSKKSQATEHTWWSFGFFVAFAVYSAIIIWVWRPNSNETIVIADAVYLLLTYLYRLNPPSEEIASAAVATA